MALTWVYRRARLKNPKADPSIGLYLLKGSWKGLQNKAPHMDLSGCFYMLGGAFCGCPCNKSPAIWGLYWAPDSWKLPYPMYYIPYTILSISFAIHHIVAPLIFRNSHIPCFTYHILYIIHMYIDILTILGPFVFFGSSHVPPMLPEDLFAYAYTAKGTGSALQSHLMTEAERCP